MQSFFNGLNGMTNFSKNLDNVSNNISNMNTPGFKGNDLFVRSLGDGTNNYGSQLESASVRLQSGDLRQTGNETDLAITGAGYFVLQNDEGEYFYTRAGQFKIDEDDKLIDSASKYRVMTINDLGVLSEMDITEQKILPPEATTAVKMVGNLTSAGTATYDYNNAFVYDTTGKKHDLKMNFTRQATPANTWTVIVRDSADLQLATFNIQFDTNTPAVGFTSIATTLTFSGQAQTVNFNFGENGSLSGATQLSGASTLAATAENGHDALGLRSFTFDEDGIVEFTYSNGDKEKGGQVALAYFNDPTKLQLSTNGLFKTQSTERPVYGKPNQELFGSIQGKSLEMSNVDLTQEFADILIIQRGYQASSRVMSVSNDMLEQLYNNTRTK